MTEPLHMERLPDEPGVECYQMFYLYEKYPRLPLKPRAETPGIEYDEETGILRIYKG